MHRVCRVYIVDCPSKFLPKNLAEPRKGISYDLVHKWLLARICSDMRGDGLQCHVLPVGAMTTEQLIPHETVSVKHTIYDVALDGTGDAIPHLYADPEARPLLLGSIDVSWPSDVSVWADVDAYTEPGDGVIQVKCSGVVKELIERLLEVPVIIAVVMQVLENHDLGSPSTSFALDAVAMGRIVVGGGVISIIIVFGQVPPIPELAELAFRRGDKSVLGPVWRRESRPADEVGAIPHAPAFATGPGSFKALVMKKVEAPSAANRGRGPWIAAQFGQSSRSRTHLLGNPG